MIRPAVKYGLEALGVFVTAVTVLTGLFMWRIAAGPVPLGFLNETLIELADAELEQGSLGLDDTVLLWVPESRQLVLSLIGVELKDATGESVVTVPEVRINVRVASLLRGVISLQKVELVGVSASIVRRADTGIELALAEAPSEKVETNIGLEALLTQLSQPADPESLLGGLVSFGMRNAALTFVDEVNAVEWRAPDATLMLSRDAGGVSALFDAILELGDARIDLEMVGHAAAGADRVEFEASGQGFVPADLARASPLFSDFSILDAPVSGKGTVTIGQNGVWLGAELQLVAGSGFAVLPALGKEPVPVDAITADFELDVVANRLLMRRLDFLAGENKGTISGEAIYDQPRGYHISGATVSLNAEDLAFNIAGFTDGVANIDGATFSGYLDFDNLAADIAALSIRVGEGTLSLSGRVADHPQSPEVRIQGEVSNILIDRLGDIWPIPLASGARDWVTENIEGGVIKTATVWLGLAGGMIAATERDEPLPMDAIDLTFTLADATVRYMDEMPVLRRVSGNGHLQGDRFDAWIDSAYTDIAGDRLQLNKGHFAALTLSEAGAPGRVEFTVAGATATILALLDHEPLGFISDYGMDPSTVGGYGEVNAVLTLPLRRDVTIEDIGLSGRAVMHDIRLPDIFANVSVDDGDLVVDVELSGLSATGPVTLNGVPLNLSWQERFTSGAGPSSQFRLTGVTDDANRVALGLDLSSLVSGSVYSDVTVRGSGANLVDGSVQVNLTDAVLKQEVIGWTKPAGSLAEGRFDLVFEPEGRVRLNAIAILGAEIDMNGSVLIGPDGDLLEANLPNVRLGTETQASFTAMLQENGVLEMHAEGPKFDARGVLTNLFSGATAPAGNAELPPDASPAATPPPAVEETNISLTARFPAVLAHGNVRASNADVDILILGGETRRMVVSGDLSEQSVFSVAISPTPEGRRVVSASSGDAGTVLRAINFYENIRGGKLAVNGTFDDLSTGAPLAGKIVVMGFRVVDAPVLASILTVGSLTGLGDLLQGEGIRFTRLELPYRMTTERFHIEDARMNGPAFGLTIRGQLDRTLGLLDLQGTIVPAYTLNSILGNVPILGDIIVGREGEGIFAATYAVRGERDRPVVTVNPLAALAPGFLRRIFEFGKVLPPEEVTAEAIDGRALAPTPLPSTATPPGPLSPPKEP